MQVMPGTFEELARRYGIAGGIDDPRANMLAGALFLRERLQARGVIGQDVLAIEEDAPTRRFDQTVEVAD